MIPQTLEQFRRLDEQEQGIFISKLLHAVKTHSDYFRFAVNMVENAQLDGLYNNVKFGSDAYKEPIY